MAVKIIRQPNKIIVLGSPTSAAAMSAGHEGAPTALRSAGLIERLRSIGYEVEDFGDDPVQISKPDEESPRARNISGVLASISVLKPRVEQAVKAGALPLILSGDCSVALATVAGVRRYFRNVGLIYMDRDADLNTPATTPSGSLDGMVVSHITGRGAAELVRFWSEPPLVRDPDVALFGVARLDPAEQELLQRSTLRSYPAADVHKKGAADAARVAVERVHGNKNEFVLHFDVDVIDDFAATDYPGEGGLRTEETRDALEVFASQPHLGAIEVTAYNPTKDPDGNGAKLVIDLLADALGKRLEVLTAAAAPAEENGEVPTPEKEKAEAEKTTVENATSPAAEPSAGAAESSHAPAPVEAGAPEAGSENPDNAGGEPQNEQPSNKPAEESGEPGESHS